MQAACAGGGGRARSNRDLNSLAAAPRLASGKGEAKLASAPVKLGAKALDLAPKEREGIWAIGWISDAPTQLDVYVNAS